MKLLLLEDDPTILNPLSAAMKQAGYSVETATSAFEAEGLARTFPFDAMIFDVSLPEGELAGFELVQRLREAGHTTPVLYLTGRDSLEDIVSGLDAGGEDYIIKPFRLPEVLARLRVQLRRKRDDARTIFAVRDLCIDWNLRQVKKEGEEIPLTSKEFGILELLASHPGRIFHRSEILERVWDNSFASDSNVVEVYVTLVRRKLGSWVIENVRGRGYRFPVD
jgi:DNA-binding response OmpR family regulator